ncbi:MAG: S8 family serine peptidase [Candidatus Hodarchaeota archaeon]
MLKQRTVLYLIMYLKRVIIIPCLLLLICTSQLCFLSVINPNFLIGDSVTNIDASEVLIDQENKDPFRSKEKNSSLINDEFQISNSLISYLRALGKNDILLSNSIQELLHETPKSMWRITKVKLIVTFNSHQQIFNHVVSSYDPEIMNILPIALFRTTLDSINNIRSLPGVTGVYLDKLIPPPENYWDSQSNVENEGIMTYPSEEIIGARYLQNLGINGTGVTIAILDTGIDKTHPDLDDIDNKDSTSDPKVILEASFIDFDDDGKNDTSPMDDHYHGTHVAGIAAANGYIRGVAPGATLMNGKVLDKTIGGYTSWIVKGIDWAVSNGADIISMSLGGLPGDLDPLFEKAIDSAWENNVTVIASAGNAGPGPSSISSPGSESRTLTVGASNVYNDIAFFSSRGPSVNGTIDPDVVAPGRGILSLDPGGGYTTASGTSMSAPAVAGVVALLLSNITNASPNQIRSALLSSASDMGRHVFTQGAGLVNATAALEHLHTQSVYAFPSFTSSSPLILSPGEVFEYQFDIFLNQSFTSLNVTTSVQLKSYVNISLIDLGQDGWIRARINVTMPNFIITNVIMVNNGSKNYYNASLSLKPDRIVDDAGSGTDAGETFIGALPLGIDVPITGEIHKWDRDIYSFPVVKDQIYSVELYNLTGNLKIFLTDENGSIFNRSSNLGHLPEKIVFKALSSGNYFIRIEDQTPGKYALLVQITDNVELFSFKPAYLTGKIWSNSVDDDSDGLFDTLEFLVEVNVSIAGRYNFWYSIAQNRSDYYFGKYIFMWNLINLTISHGLQNLTISVPGGIIQSSGFNGSYIINELALGKNDFSLLFNHDLEVFVTPNFNHTSFDPLDNYLQTIDIGEKDLDGNGVPEKIIVELGFYFTSSGIYGVGVPVFNENQNEILAFNTETIRVSQPGLVTVKIEFIAQKFQKLSDIAVFGVAGSWFRYLIPVFSEISKETLATFDPIINYTITDDSVDLNGNSQNDALRFIFSVTSKIKTTALLFTGHPFSYPNETITLINSSEKTVQLNLGSNEVFIDLDARILKSRGLNGPYFLPDLGLTVSEFEMTLKTPYISQYYSFSAFETALVRFSNFFGGTKYNSSSEAGLELIWEITSTQQIEVNFEFDVRDYDPLQGEFSKTIEFNKEINIGVSNLTIRINAEDLYNSSYIGGLEVYYASIFLSDIQYGLRHRFQEHNLSLIDFTFHVGILPSVDYREYSMYVDAFFIKIPEISFIRVDSQNLYDGVSVNTTIGVNQIGTYTIVIDLFSKNDYLLLNIENKTSLVASEPNNYSLNFFFSAETIAREGFNQMIYGNISVSNTSSLTVSESKIPHFIFNISELNYILPVNTISKVIDKALDSNQDGKFDAIFVILTVNVTSSSNYGFSIGFYSQLNHFYEAYLGNVTLIKQYFTAGVHNITVQIPYYYLLAINSKADEFKVTPEIKIIMVPLFGEDGKRKFLISAEPMFLESQYDLSQFYLVQPMSFGLVKFIQSDIDADGIADTLDAIISIVVNDILSYSLEIELEVFWQQKSNIIKKKFNYNPKGLGVFQTDTRFFLSEIFVSPDLPSRYTVKGHVKIISYDGIQIDSYVTPFSIAFETEISFPNTSTPTTDTPEGGNNISVFQKIIGLILIASIIICLTGGSVILYRRLYKVK